MKKSKYIKEGEVPHHWAHQIGEAGKPAASKIGNGPWHSQAQTYKGSRMHYEGTAVYSYNTVIGRIIEHRGRRAFVLDRASFSPTTSKHQQLVRRAIPETEAIFNVYCGGYNQRLDFTAKSLRDHYLAESRDELKGAKSKIAAARDIVARFEKLNQALRVAEHFRLPAKKIEKLIAKNQTRVNEAGVFLAEHEKKVRTATEKRAESKRLGNAERRAAYIAERIKVAEGDLTELRNRELHFGRGWVGTEWGEDDHELESRPDLQAKVRAERERLAKLTVDDWLNNVPHAPEPDGAVLLRVNDGEIETSKGARIPLADGERAFRFAVALKENGWHKNGEQFKVGNYELDAINEAGVVAGCHRISWPVIEAFAKAQGWA